MLRQAHAAWQTDLDSGRTSLLITAERRDDAATTAELPSEYAGHVDLGYALTVHRAQGATVDTAHVTPSELAQIRELLAILLDIP